MTESGARRGNDGLLFVAVLVVLSAAAIWFVEGERPRQEEARVAATRTQIVVARREATAQSRQTATTQARQTATTRARQTATARARQTATTRARQTATAQSRQTATTQARQTATTRARQTATARARQTATTRARQTATAQARMTATAIALQNPDIRLRILDDPDGESLHIDAQSHLRFEGRLEVVIYDDDNEERKTFVLTIPENERGYLRMDWKYPLSGSAITRKRLMDRVEGVFKPTGSDSEPLRCVKHLTSLTQDFYSCNYERGSRVYISIMRTATADVLRTETAVARLTATEPVGVHLTVNAENRLTATAKALAQAATARIRTATAEPRLATSQVRQTGAAHARQTATAFIVQNAAASNRQTEVARMVATQAVARRTAAAQSRDAIVGTADAIQTARASTQPTRTSSPTVQRNVTSWANIQTATAEASRTVYASARPTSTPRPTTYYVRQSSPVNVRSCASTTCALVGTIPPGQAIAVLREEEGNPVNGDTRWLAFTFDGQTRYLHASLATMTQPTEPPRPTRTLIPTRTPRSTATMAIRSLPPQTYYVTSTAANARLCPQHLDPENPCPAAQRFNYRDSVTVVGETRGDAYQGSTLWKVIEHGNQRLYIHATLLSLNRPPAATNTAVGNGAGGNDPDGCNTCAPYVSGSCRVGKRKNRAMRFPTGRSQLLSRSRSR